MKDLNDVLLFIVGRISDEPGVKSACYRIAALNYNSMSICFYEFLIEENIPLRMQQFTTAVLDDGFPIYTLTPMFSDEILDSIWKLLDIRKIQQ
jgi:hypothetical protein